MTQPHPPRTEPATTIPALAAPPLRIAFRLVLQGLRARVERSLLTLSGIALGVAFLTAVLSTQALRHGARAEEQVRESANRLHARLVSETGSLAGRRVAFIVTGPPDAAERGLLRKLEADAPSELVLAPGSSAEPDLFAHPAQTTADFAAGARAIVVLGAGPLPPVHFAAARGEKTQPLVAFASARTAALPGARSLVLAERLTNAERAERNAEERRSRARTLFLVAISLLVMVMGIVNSMLTSVAERFREIGTLRCLGALASFVRTLFLLEAALLGTLGAVLGTLAGMALSVLAYLLPFGPVVVGQVLAHEARALAVLALASIATGVLLTLGAALYPAAVAARRLPADALRSSP